MHLAFDPHAALDEVVNGDVLLRAVDRGALREYYVDVVLLDLRALEQGRHRQDVGAQHLEVGYTRHRPRRLQRGRHARGIRWRLGGGATQRAPVVRLVVRPDVVFVAAPRHEVILGDHGGGQAALRPLRRAGFALPQDGVPQLTQGAVAAHPFHHVFEVVAITRELQRGGEQDTDDQVQDAQRCDCDEGQDQKEHRRVQLLHGQLPDDAAAVEGGNLQHRHHAIQHASIVLLQVRILAPAG
mmetsp:Transcript_59166/g.152188  ORF Transcript_59166/g.152188 Transcript_59166/m.152188 type:complete len:241 (+) Transcript_59166:2554-3276(+)